MKRLLLPTDFSERADCAMDWAVDLANRYRAGIDVLHAWTPLVNAEEIMSWITLEDSHELLHRSSRDLMEARCGPEMEATLRRLRQRDVRKVRGLVEPGAPAQVILRIAQSHEHDMIVMSSHGRSGMSEVLIGGCTERVVRRSPIPVLVVPTPRSELRTSHPPDDEPRWIDWPATGFS